MALHCCAASILCVLFACADEFPPTCPVATSTLKIDAAQLPTSVKAVRGENGVWSVEFACRPPRPVESLSLAGTFNGWNASATLMRRGDDATWRARIDLPDGRHLYKFVAGGKEWNADRENPVGEDDGHGGQNSVLALGSAASLSGAKAQAGDGFVEGGGLSHDPSLASDLSTSADHINFVQLRLRTLHDDVDHAAIATRSGLCAMTREGVDGQFDWWVGQVAAVTGDPYTFVVEDGDSEFRMDEVFTLPDLSSRAIATPDWAKDAIWYQVMVDRFRNGSSKNDPAQVKPWRSSWYSPTGDEGKDGQKFFQWYVYKRLYGGDLQGLQEQLPYIKALGVNAIYLNPIFQAVSHHKYDATNYLHIDEHYGQPGDYALVEARENLLDPSTWEWTASDRVFLAFLKEAKSQGFRVILDGVFNHVGTPHPAFRDVKSRGKESPYADWFTIRSWEPFEYDGWAGFGDLPAFAKSSDGLASASLRDHIFAMTRRWMDPNGDGDPSDGIDGWRLDVPMELPMQFWREWREFVKGINPDCYIVGEVWQQADAWLDGRTMDAVMNYPFANAVTRWVGAGDAKIAPSILDTQLSTLRRAYAPEVTLVMQNLVDSHDTDRLVSHLHNMRVDFDAGNREQENPRYDGSKPTDDDYTRARLAVLIQMTYIGAPMVYYGDEVGMWGADDPTNRKPMLWKDLEPYDDAVNDVVMDEQLAFYRRAIALRANERALRRGSFRTLLADDSLDVFAFERVIDDEHIVVVLNASDGEQTVNLGGKVGANLDANGVPLSWKEIFRTSADSAATTKVDQSFSRVIVPPKSGVVFKRSGVIGAFTR